VRFVVLHREKVENMTTNGLSTAEPVFIPPLRAWKIVATKEFPSSTKIVVYRKRNPEVAS
jgi:hypothetical protein